MAIYKRRYVPYKQRTRLFGRRMGTVFVTKARYAFAGAVQNHRFFVLRLILRSESSFHSCLCAGLHFISPYQNGLAIGFLSGPAHVPADMFSLESKFFTLIMIVQTQISFSLELLGVPVLYRAEIGPTVPSSVS